MKKNVDHQHRKEIDDLEKNTKENLKSIVNTVDKWSLLKSPDIKRTTYDYIKNIKQMTEEFMIIINK